ncbi:MAG: hypothetical protein K2I14_08375 [Eubacterium sp.]|nr:hypothetical protein [Eubacterium sp.]
MLIYKLKEIETQQQAETLAALKYRKQSNCSRQLLFIFAKKPRKAKVLRAHAKL